MKKLNKQDFNNLWRPATGSHKGENGRLLVIGGSQLFHASIFWSADVASRIVDLVHFSSPAEENNQLIRMKLKEKFWSGIVVPFDEVEEYIQEDDCVLIGPGMPRKEGLMEGERPTGEITNELLREYGDKKWVVDGGALQEVDSSLLGGSMIITPHLGEWERLVGEVPDEVEKLAKQVVNYSKQHENLTVLLKGEDDLVCRGEEIVMVEGGNGGMTKGGTGDVLAGLVAALSCKNDSFLAAQAASWANKQAGHRLSEKVGPYFNAGDLVGAVPEVLGEL